MLYLTDTDDRPQDGPPPSAASATWAARSRPIDYKTGKVKWSRPLAMGAGGSVGGVGMAC